MENWLKIKLKYCTDFIQQKYSDEDYSYIGLENIISGNGKFIETESVYDRSQSLIFQKDDVLFGKLRPYLSKVYHANKNGCCSSEFCVIRPNKKILPKFLWHILISPDFINKVNCSTYGTKMPRANADFIKNLQIPLPPFEIQQKIADILDQKCAAIDECIEKTKATIEKYKKLKASIITETVTGKWRIDNGELKIANLKDSGIEWIGEIPEHWEVRRLKTICKIRGEKNSPNSTVLSLYRDLGVVIKSERNDNHNVTSEDTSDYKIVKINDLVVNKMKAWQGSIAVSKYEGIVSSAYYVLIFFDTKVFPMYIHYLLRNQTYLPEYRRLSGGIRIGQWDLSIDNFYNISILIPPLSEQTAIANYLDTKCTEIDSIIATKEKLVIKLEQYKKSIIFEYVTGKKEI